jgi:hypothetical protein
MIAWRGALLALLFLIRYRHQISFHASLVWLHSTSAWTNRQLRLRCDLDCLIRKAREVPAMIAFKPRLTPVRL